MSSYQESLALLFKAEEEANRMITEAENKKQIILEEALAQCHQEIESKRNEMEHEFKKKSSSNQNNFDQLLKEAVGVKGHNETEYRANKEQVIQMLMDRIFNVNIEISKNIKGDFHKQFKKVRN